MSLNDSVAMVLSQLNNAVRVGKDEITTSVSSSLLKHVLELMQDGGYVQSVEEVVDSKGNTLKIKLSGSLNGCGVIKPRFAIKADNFEKFEKRFLPAKGFGFLIISTNQGLLTHNKAKELGIGGKLVSFCY